MHYESNFSAAVAALARFAFRFCRFIWRLHRLVATQDGAPLKWVLRGRHFQRVVVHWGKQRLDSRDPQIIARFDSAIRPALASFSYPTFNLPDRADQKKWNVVLFDQRNQPFEVIAEIYDGGGFYTPSVGSSYSSRPYFFSLSNSVFGKPESHLPSVYPDDFK